MQRLFLIAFLAFGLTFAVAQSSAVKFTAPPVVNHITDHSVDLLWSTNTATTTLVNYGTDANDLSLHATRSVAAPQHELTLEHLQPHTTYYYEVVNRNGSEPAKGSFTTR